MSAAADCGLGVFHGNSPWQGETIPRSWASPRKSRERNGEVWRRELGWNPPIRWNRPI